MEGGMRSIAGLRSIGRESRRPNEQRWGALRAQRVHGGSRRERLLPGEQSLKLLSLRRAIVSVHWLVSRSYSSPKALSKSARAVQNTSKACRYCSSAVASDAGCCSRSLSRIACCEYAPV